MQGLPFRRPLVELEVERDLGLAQRAVVGDLVEVELLQRFPQALGVVVDRERHRRDCPGGGSCEPMPFFVPGFGRRLQRPGKGESLDPSAGEHPVCLHGSPVCLHESTMTYAQIDVNEQVWFNSYQLTDQSHTVRFQLANGVRSPPLKAAVDFTDANTAGALAP
jgi:hypothetical protein